MKLNRALKLRHVGSSYFIVDPGQENIDMSNIITLSPAAAFLWETFRDQEFTVETMADSLCERYDVSREQAVHDINEMLEQWQEFNLMA